MNNLSLIRKKKTLYVQANFKIEKSVVYHARRTLKCWHLFCHQQSSKMNEQKRCV